MLSDDTSWAAMEKKIGEYHASGVDLVWVLDPRTITLQACAHGAPPVLLREADVRERGSSRAWILLPDRGAGAG